MRVLFLMPVDGYPSLQQVRIEGTATGGPKEDPALGPFPALPSTDNELPALLFTSHRCGQ